MTLRLTIRTALIPGFLHALGADRLIAVTTFGARREAVDWPAARTRQPRWNSAR